jgi:hypothetical protein
LTVSASITAMTSRAATHAVRAVGRPTLDEVGRALRIPKARRPYNEIIGG